MAGSIFRETLRRSWRQVLYWGVGIGLLGLYISIVLQDVDFLEQYAKIAEAMPPVLMQMFGITDAATLATPEGFISFGFFSYALLIFAVYAVIAGLNVTANEEDEGVMDVLLSLPVARRRVLLEKFAAYTLMVLGIVLIGYLGLWAGIQAAQVEISTSRVAESTINMIPGILVMLTFTIFIATVVRRKSTATAIAATFVIVSYFVDFLGEAASESLANTLRAFSFFSYYDATGVMRAGLNVGNVLVLLAASAILVGGSLWAFDRRDVGV